LRQHQSFSAPINAGVTFHEQAESPLAPSQACRHAFIRTIENDSAALIPVSDQVVI
jgi:hypothetical protein